MQHCFSFQQLSLLSQSFTQRLEHFLREQDLFVQTCALHWGQIGGCWLAGCTPVSPRTCRSICVLCIFSPGMLTYQPQHQPSAFPTPNNSQKRALLLAAFVQFQLLSAPGQSFPCLHCPAATLPNVLSTLSSAALPGTSVQFSQLQLPEPHWNKPPQKLHLQRGANASSAIWL